MTIQRMNMDNTWHIELDGLRILTDPWLEGEEVDFFPWFNKQWHRTKPADYSAVPTYDVVLITQKYPDHFHPVTLQKLQPKKLIVPHTIASKVQKLFPAAEVIAMGKEQSHYTLEGASFTWLPTRRPIDPIYDAVYINGKTEALFIASHGFEIDEKYLAEIDKQMPIKLLISPYNLYQLPALLGGTVSPGLKGLQHLNEALHPQHIVATHDEDKHAEGLVTKFAKVVRIGRQDLKDYPDLYNKALDAEHYNVISL